MKTKPMTRRSYLILRTCERAISDGTPQLPFHEVIESVAATAQEHPDWDMDELKTWDDWEETTQ